MAHRTLTALHSPPLTLVSSMMSSCPMLLNSSWYTQQISTYDAPYCARAVVVWAEHYEVGGEEQLEVERERLGHGEDKHDVRKAIEQLFH